MVWLGLAWKGGLARVLGWEMDRWAGVRMGQKSKKETGIFKLIPGWLVVAISFLKEERKCEEGSCGYVVLPLLVEKQTVKKAAASYESLCFFSLAAGAF